MNSSQLIILDRDGVINLDSADYIKNPDEWQPIFGSLSAIAKLTQAGYTVAVATNQSGIARKYFSLGTLTAIHHKMQLAVKQAGGLIDKIVFCPHVDDDDCSCRKPRPGLFEQLRQAYQLENLQATVSIGDAYRDYLAAKQAGCGRFILVKTGKGLATLANYHHRLIDADIVENLSAAADLIIKR